AAAPAAADDILAGFGTASSASDPFADLIPAPASSRPVRAPTHSATPPPAARSSSSPGQLPDDFDPFGEPAPPPAPSSAPQNAGPRGDFSDLVPAQTEGVDQLFGLRGGEPFPPNHPLAAPSAASTPGPVGIDDLLRPGAPPPTAPRDGSFMPTQRDDASELNAQVRLPQGAPSSSVVHHSPPDSAEGGATTTGGMMLSWDEAGSGGVFDGTRTMVISGESAERRRAERRQPVAPVALAEPPAEPAAPSTTPLEKRPLTADETELTRALLEGLGLERWPDPSGVDAETMRRIGKLMRAAVQGTIDLLRARATIKSEVQAQMTMIVTRDNNPLKFSPNVGAALAHLLGPAQRGFMSATAAMDDAYRDLVAHQFGFTAGTRAALADVLRRFDPAALEQRLVAKSMLDSLLPANYKAKLWHLFTERFAQISTEAEEDFQRLFGKEFVRAYEAQVAKMNLPGHNEKKE
ncbi:MAG TPA: type VI secretion system-associated FHA domain protein TagH, partial [Burkholderiaceae bacterium]|nr:type VI secretion system-associated FHA domain protein TagH [Burkholderiaceae bacterium]